jgi:2-acylglycerol O-acyltransferase 2
MPLVRFAPLTVPLHRRLQTLVVALTASIFFLCVGLLVFCLLNPFTYPLLIPYFLWIATDTAPETGGRRVQWIRRRRIWRWMRDYFPCSLVCETQLDPKKKYVMGYHPHGIIATGLWINFLPEANEISQRLPGITIVRECRY